MIKRCVDLGDCFNAIEELMEEKDNRIKELEEALKKISERTAEEHETFSCATCEEMICIAKNVL